MSEKVFLEKNEIKLVNISFRRNPRDLRIFPWAYDTFLLETSKLYMSAKCKASGYLRLGLKLKRIIHVLEFSQSRQFKRYIEFNTKKE